MMPEDTQLIELKVETHPSGRWTLVSRQGPGIFEQLRGDLCGNGDAAEFYRAVARYMAELSAEGTRFVYNDTDL